MAPELKDLTFKNQVDPNTIYRYGFSWGAAKVERLASSVKEGWIILGITTPKEDMQVYVTKTGKVRVWSPGGEWAQPKKKGKKK